MGKIVNFEFPAVSREDLSPVLSNSQVVNSPLVFEISFSGLAGAYAYSDIYNLNKLFLGSSQGFDDKDRIAMINAFENDTFVAVSDAIKKKTPDSITDLYHNSKYGVLDGVAMDFLNVLSSQYSRLSGVFNTITTPFDSTQILPSIAYLEHNLKGWHVAYFQYVKFGTVQHLGDTYLDSAKILVALIPISNNSGSSSYIGFRSVPNGDEVVDISSVISNLPLLLFVTSKVPLTVSNIYTYAADNDQSTNTDDRTDDNNSKDKSLSLKFKFSNEGKYGLSPIVKGDKVTTPFMFEMTFSNLVEGYGYSPWLELDEDDTDSFVPDVNDINSMSLKTEQAVARVLENPTKENLIKLATDPVYGWVDGKVANFMMYLDQRYSAVVSGLFLPHGADPFDTSNIQSAQKELQDKLEKGNWQVVYFQYIKFGTVVHEGHTFIDSATMLIAVVPKQNGKPVTPISFEDNTSSSNYELGVGSLIKFGVIIAGLAFLAWTLKPIVVSLGQGLKLLPPLPTTALSIGEMAIMGLGALALVMLILSNKHKT